MKRLALFTSILSVIVMTAVACSNDEGFVSQSTTETFVQDYNPHFLEVLWVIDDRSPMRNYRTRLISEAQTLFQKIDGQLGEFGQYRMGITNVDGVYHQGELKPIGSPIILTRTMGTLAQRTTFFGNIFFPLLNLSTGAENIGFEGSLKALTSTFPTDPRVPLVLIYLSYSDDESDVTSGVDPVDHFAAELLKLKNGRNDLLRVYAANYLPVGPGVTPTSEQRCARLNDNEIDISPGSYENRYFRLAQKLNGSTADLCAAGLANNLDLTGLQLKTLPKRFALQGYPLLETLQVSIVKDGLEIPGFTWGYDPTTREIVFDETPPQGTSIVVTFLPGGEF